MKKTDISRPDPIGFRSLVEKARSPYIDYRANIREILFV